MPHRDRTLQKEIRWRPPKCDSRLPAPLVQIGDALAPREAQPDSPSTPGARVLDRDLTVLAGYHPSRRPVGTARDRAQIGTKTASTSPESISGLRLPRRGAQGGVAPPATEYCGRRSGDRLQNAIITFQPPWYKLETP